MNRLALLITFVAALCVPIGCGYDFTFLFPPLEVVEEVDLERYAGLWYEIAKYPVVFEAEALEPVCHIIPIHPVLTDAVILLRHVFPGLIEIHPASPGIEPGDSIMPDGIAELRSSQGAIGIEGYNLYPVLGQRL